MAVHDGPEYALEFLMHTGEVGLGKATLAGKGLRGEQQSPQVSLVHISGKWPPESGLFSPLQVVHHRAVTDVECLGNTPVTEFGLVAKPQDVLDFTH